MFLITHEPISIIQKSFLNDQSLDDCGALVSFEGLVRNHNEGKSVQSLEYQCYEAMALKIGNEIIQDTINRFPISKAICLHREGHLEIGEIAVWVGVYSHHRAEAFDACRFIIDQVKLLVPIWKKEHYHDFEPVWVACHQCAHPHHAGAHAHE